MRGYKDFNFPVFDIATEQLRKAGYIVASPAEMDRACGFTVEVLNSMTKKELVAYSREVFPRDVAVICVSGGIAYLPGSFDSKGCNAEISCGRAVDIEFKSVDMWLKLAEGKENE